MIEEEVKGLLNEGLLQITGNSTAFRRELYTLVDKMDLNPATKVYADKLDEMFKKYLDWPLR